jgi:flavin-dependent dehydrogenase
MSNRYQRVIVIGGGPAGLTSAIALQRVGCRVTVIDCAVPPIDKACGEGLMPDSIAELRHLGIELPPHAGHPFRGIRFADASSSVAADFPNGVARGVRRTVLHRLLVERAFADGVNLVWNAKHVSIDQTPVCVDGAPIPADLLVGADGQNSVVRRRMGLDVVERQTRRYGFRRHYRVAPWSEYVDLHWSTRCQIYVTPLAQDEVGVAVISRDSKLRLHEALSEFPELGSKLQHAEPVSAEMGALSVSRTLRSVSGEGVALVGDASGSVDAITGEGIGLATTQARALAAAVRNGDLAQYRQQHRKLMRRPQTMASLMLLLDRDAGLQRRAIFALSQNPMLFESLLAMHVGAGQIADFFSWRLMSFGRSFVTA